MYTHHTGIITRDFAGNQHCCATVATSSLRSLSQTYTCIYMPNIYVYVYVNLYMHTHAHTLHIYTRTVTYTHARCKTSTVVRLWELLHFCLSLHEYIL